MTLPKQFAPEITERKRAPYRLYSDKTANQAIKRASKKKKRRRKAKPPVPATFWEAIAEPLEI